MADSLLFQSTSGTNFQSGSACLLEQNFEFEVERNFNPASLKTIARPDLTSVGSDRG